MFFIFFNYTIKIYINQSKNKKYLRQQSYINKNINSGVYFQTNLILNDKIKKKLKKIIG
jgi:hypothetical protein